MQTVLFTFLFRLQTPHNSMFALGQ